jgi:hypothetical protein
MSSYPGPLARKDGDLHLRVSLKELCQALHGLTLFLKHLIREVALTEHAHLPRFDIRDGIRENA